MRSKNAKVYSIMNAATVNTMMKAEIQSWVIDTRLRNDPEFMFQVLKTIPYDSKFGMVIAAIVADLKTCWRVGEKDPKTRKWECYEEGNRVAEAIAANKAVKKKLGTGAFSSAFLMKDGRVMKVNSGKSAYDPWLGWATRCKELSGSNPFMPRIYGLVNYGTTYSAFMERLEPWHKRKPMRYQAFHAMDDMIMEQPREVYRRIQDSGSVMGPDATYLKFEEVSESIKSIVQATFKARVDLHSDNAMFRGNQLVITDPLAWGNTPEMFKPYIEVVVEPKVESFPKRMISKATKALKNKLYFDFDMPKLQLPKLNEEMLLWGHGNGGRNLFNEFQKAEVDRLRNIWFKPNARAMENLWHWPKVDVCVEQPELPLFKVKDNGKRFGLSVDKVENAKNFRSQHLPKPWFREMEDQHNDMYNALVKDMFAVGEPQKRHTFKILKGRKEVMVEAAQAP